VNPGSIVLVDTNVIIEAHRTNCWNQISESFDLRTVAKVVEETQTGFQNRQPETWIDEANLRASLGAIINVTETDRVTFNMNHGHPSLDDGERDLLIYAETLTEPMWLLNSPDMAAVKFAHQNGWIDRLVSLEAMASRLKARLRADLKGQYTDRWLSQKKISLLLTN
jgi:hypothetical protein